MEKDVYHKDLGIGWWLITVGILLFIISSLWLIPIFKIVPAGTVGVYDIFGKVEDQERQSGFNLKNPLAAIRTMTIKSQQIEEKASVPSNEGLIVNLDVSIIFKIQPEMASDIYKTIGTNYVDIIVIPNLRSQIRDVTASYQAKDLYTQGRALIEKAIFDNLSPILSERGIVLEKVLLRDIQLPDSISAAIQAKLTAEQQIEQKRFEVKREIEEAERKIVEAGGIAEAQKIINEGLTREYLTWYWISHIKDATSVFYIPTGEDGLPIFKEVGNQ